MPSILDKLRGVLRRTTNTAADLASALTDARRAETDAVASVERQAAAVAANFLDPDAKRERDRQELERLRLAAGDAAAIREALERRHGAALAGDAAAIRAATYAAAKAKADALGATLAKRYTDAAGAIVALLGDIAEVNALVDAANADRPADAPELPQPEMLVRSTPGLPWMPDEVETVERWAFSDGTPVQDAHLGNVVDYGQGRGSYKTKRVEGIDDVEAGQPVEMRRFRHVTSYQPTPGTYLTELARSIRLPNLYAPHNLIGGDFVPNTWTPGADLVRDAEQRLAAMAKPVPAEGDRPMRVELRPIWTPAEVAKANSPATDFHDRTVRPATGSRFGASPFQRAGARAGARR